MGFCRFVWSEWGEVEFILCLCVCLLTQMIGCFGVFCFIELDVSLF